MKKSLTEIVHLGAVISTLAFGSVGVYGLAQVGGSVYSHSYSPVPESAVRQIKVGGIGCYPSVGVLLASEYLLRRRQKEKRASSTTPSG